MKIAVIGAGIAGITSAYYLAKDGHKVHVYEQEPHPAMRTSLLTVDKLVLATQKYGQLGLT